MGVRNFFEQPTRVFHVFRQQVTELSQKLTGTQQQEGGIAPSMRYAKALPRDFRFLPGLHGAGDTGASQPIQNQHGTRDEGNTTHIFHARRVVFRCCLFLPLAVSISFVSSYLPDGDYPPRSRRGKNVVCLLYTSPSPRDQRGSRMPSSA